MNKNGKKRTRIPRHQLPAVERINKNFASTAKTQPAPPAIRHKNGRDIKAQALSAHLAKTEALELPSTTNQCCAIIGNASSIFQKRDGDYIDKFNIVVRINTIRIREAACQGKRTNTLFVHDGTVMNIPRRVYKTVDVININTDIPELYTYWFNRIKQEINEDARVTTGFMAVLAMMQLDYHISLFGFDWYETPTYYTNRGPWKKHHPNWEKAILTELLEAHNEKLRNNATEPQVLTEGS